uniref:Uncharacterized protein n=1 Tax=Arundo donax TaxID=35708 RepID=A0A0A9BUV1_ARUDO
MADAYPSTSATIAMPVSFSG